MYSEEGRRQLAKIKELHLVADRLGCTASQLAIGECLYTFVVSQAYFGQESSTYMSSPTPGSCVNSASQIRACQTEKVLVIIVRYASDGH